MMEEKLKENNMELKSNTYIVDIKNRIKTEQPAHNWDITPLETVHPELPYIINEKLQDKDAWTDIYMHLEDQSNSIEELREVLSCLNGNEHFISKESKGEDRDDYYEEMSKLVEEAAEYYEHAIKQGLIPVYKYEGINKDESEYLEEEYDAWYFPIEAPELIELILKRKVRELIDPDYDLEQRTTVSDIEGWFSKDEIEAFRKDRQMIKDLFFIKHLDMTLVEVQQLCA